MKRKVLIYTTIMLLVVSFAFCSKNMFPVFGDTPDFSESHYNYIIMDYPAVSVDEVYSIYANYHHGYDVWEVYMDDFYCDVNNGRESYYNWYVFPDSSKYYENGSLVLNTNDSRIDYQVMYPASDELLYANTKSFSAYLGANNSSGVAYGATRFECGLGTFWISPEAEISF